MYYVPGFSNYLDGLSSVDEVSPEATSAYGNYQSLPADSYAYAPASDYGMGYQSLPADTATQVPMGALTQAAAAPATSGLAYTTSGMPVASDPNMTEEQFLAALAQAPRVPMAATSSFTNPLAAARNAGLPSNLQYGNVTMNANPNFDPNAQFSLPPGAELTMTQDEINNARVLWQNQNATYQPKSWMISTGPTGAGAVNMSLVSGNPYVLRNNKTGEIVAQGSDDATLEKIANLISGGSLGDEWQLFEPGTSSYGNVTFGQPDAWGNTGYGNSEYVEGANGQPGYWLNPIAGAKPAPSVLGNLLTHALTMFGPALVAPYLAPALSGPGALGSKFLGNVAAGALTGGAASGITGGDILKGALTGGAAAGALYGLGSVVGPGANTPSTGGGSSGGGGSTVPSSVYTGDVAPITVIGSSVTPTFGVPGLFNQVPTSVNTNKLEAGRAPTTVDSTGINPMEYFAPMVDGGAFDLGGALPAAEANQIVAMAPSGGLNMAAGVAPAVAQIGYDIATGKTPIEVKAAQQTEKPAEPLTGGLSNVVDGVDQTTGEIVAAGKKADDVVTVPGGIQSTATPVPTEIVVPGAKQTYTQDVTDIADLTGLTPQEVLDAQNSTTDTNSRNKLSDIIDYLRLAGLGTSLIGSLFDGGGQQGATLPGGFGSGALNSTFNKQLPGANIPGLGGGASSGPRTAADLGQQGLNTTQDYYRYGYGPEQSFFNYVQPTRPNTSTAYTGYAKGGGAEAPDYDYAAAERAGIRPDEYGHMPDTYKLPNHMTFSQDSVYSTPEHEGGKWIETDNGGWVFWPSEYNMTQHDIPTMERYFRETEQGRPGRPDSYAVYPSDYRLPKGRAKGGFAVEGPGDGREDKIPAMLSDGEYVMDAETVAMLGNGSNKAGAEMLDKFRVNLRKHKGREMARGKFSKSAKKPEQYLAGGRS